VLPSSFLLLTLPFLGGGVRTDLGAAVGMEARAGMIPLQAGQAASPAVNSTVNLLVGGRLRSRRSSLELTYSPELFFQVPGTIELGRPLVLHQGRLSYQNTITARTSAGLSVLGRVGEVSFNNLQDILQPGTGVVQAEVTSLALTTGTLSLNHQTSRRNEIGAEAMAGYQTPLDSASALSPSTLPTSLDTSLALTDTYSLSALDRLGVSVRGGYLISQRDSPTAPSNDLQRLVAFGGSFSWARQISLRSSITSNAGWAFTYIQELAIVSLVPIAVVNYDVGWGRRNQQWQATFTGGVRGFLDRASATYRPQGFARAQLRGAFGPKWTSNLSLFASTSLAPDPLVPSQYESTASVIQTTNYRVSNRTIFRFGARASLRGNHLNGSENLLRPQGELTGFVGLRYNLGTSRADGSWLR